MPVGLKVSHKNLELVEKKLETVNPTLFRDAFLKMKLPKKSHWKLLRRVWKKNKGNAVAYVFMLPFSLFQVKNTEKFLKKYEEKFIDLNKKLKKILLKAEKESEKMFLKTFIDLNTIAIKMTPLLLEQNRRIEEGEKLRETFLLKPTTENLLRLWNSIEYSLKIVMKIAEFERKKADIQDEVMKYERQMTKFEKRDIEDFWRAILTDLLISYKEQKILLVGTPIEILLKSHKMMNKIREAFLLTDVLRVSAEVTVETQNRLIEWFIAYEEKS